jgi:hypothetical protein
MFEDLVEENIVSSTWRHYFITCLKVVDVFCRSLQLIRRLQPSRSWSASKLITQSARVLALRDTGCLGGRDGKHFGSFE